MALMWTKTSLPDSGLDEAIALVEVEPLDGFTSRQRPRRRGPRSRPVPEHRRGGAGPVPSRQPRFRPDMVRWWTVQLSAVQPGTAAAASACSAAVVGVHGGG